MPVETNICVVIPVFNHDPTTDHVVREAMESFPVIVVRHGSSGDAHGMTAEEGRVTVITLPHNWSKGAVLRAGFAEAEKHGYTHAVTIDAKSRHAKRELTTLAAASRKQPEALVVGVRDWANGNASLVHRVINNIFSFWFKFETGVALADTQGGSRSYPLTETNPLHVKSRRCSYESEIMVKAAWAGVPLVALPITSDDPATTSRLALLAPWSDLMAVSFLHLRLCIQTFCFPAFLRKIFATGELRHLPPGKRVKTILHLLFSEHTDTSAKFASAIGLGFFCGLAPIWGFQTIVAATLSHRFRLNKVIAMTATHISFPLTAPFFMAGGLLFGHFLHTGALLPFNPASLTGEMPTRLAEWFFGSIALGIVVGVAGAIITWLICRLFAGNRTD